jgi:hypothetical protein
MVAMTKNRVTKKKAVRKAKEKAAESGISVAQKTFAKVWEKADPKR